MTVGEFLDARPGRHFPMQYFTGPEGVAGQFLGDEVMLLDGVICYPGHYRRRDDEAALDAGTWETPVEHKERLFNAPLVIVSWRQERSETAPFMRFPAW